LRSTEERESCYFIFPLLHPLVELLEEEVENEGGEEDEEEGIEGWGRVEELKDSGHRFFLEWHTREYGRVNDSVPLFLF